MTAEKINNNTGIVFTRSEIKVLLARKDSAFGKFVFVTIVPNSRGYQSVRKLLRYFQRILTEFPYPLFHKNCIEFVDLTR